MAGVAGAALVIDQESPFGGKGGTGRERDLAVGPIEIDVVATERLVGLVPDGVFADQPRRSVVPRVDRGGTEMLGVLDRDLVLLVSVPDDHACRCDDHGDHEQHDRQDDGGAERVASPSPP